MSIRPVALPPNPAAIPAALTSARRWAVWRYEWDGTRWVKMPYQAFGHGRAAKANDPATWTTVRNALARLPRYDGISFALGDGWAGIDVDNYRGPIETTAYRETSPGGVGIKIIGRASRIGGEIKCFGELRVKTRWEGARFFTITGQDSEGDPLHDISALIDTHFPHTPGPPRTREGYALAATLSDDDLLLQMVGTDGVGDRILELWRGDTSAHRGDHSRADQALCCHLAFWTNYDADRIDRLFRQSGLMRPKWDTNSYRRATLAKALR